MRNVRYNERVKRTLLITYALLFENYFAQTLLPGETTRVASLTSRVLLPHLTLLTWMETIRGKIFRMKRRECYARDAGCTLRAECKTQSARRG
jgi:hypothetical protein